jgi:heterodisulfide reductase subunit B
MKYTFFPGCSLESTARDFRESTMAISKALGVELEELPRWTCCGSTPAHAVDTALSIALPVRNLVEAAMLGRDLVVVCAACYSRLQSANLAMQEDAEMRSRIEDIIGMEYRGEIRVRHLLEVLTSDVGVDTIKNLAVRDLSGLRMACYCGCLLSRPREISIFPDPEAPRMMEDLLLALGAEPVEWTHAQECCGGSFGITNRAAAERLSHDILDMAKTAGANCLAAACPLCQSNLDMRQKDIEKRFGITFDLPVFYFTQLLGLALGLPEKSLGLHRLFTKIPARFGDRD